MNRKTHTACQNCSGRRKNLSSGDFRSEFPFGSRLGQTENSVREIYLSDEAIRLLVEDRKNHPFSPYMFPSPKTGGMYGPDCVGRIHKKLLEKAGIEEHVRFHDLRHTFSTLAIQSGIDPKTVAEILGHASAEFSLDVYTHVTAGMKKEAAQKISGFMAGVG